ncbi:MAG: elongation factor P [Simkaniaceae bacterium]|nr:elongation factor P [Simkaniaceae bacterium]
MAQVSTNEFKTGMKVEMNREPYTIVGVEFVKPGKGQAFTRTKLKHLMSGRVVEKTFKSGEKLDLADVEETQMRMLYTEGDDVVFMHDQTYEQITVSLSVIDDKKFYMMEDTVYGLIFYKGDVVDITPPTFLNMTVTETAPGVRGDTASGRVVKPAKTNTGATIQIPIFIEEGELVKVDTRTGEYVSRVKE